MMLRAFLVDDEPLAVERLQRLLQRTGRVTVIGSAIEPEQALVALPQDPPDVCFLDIHMPRLTGFDVLARLPCPPTIVFTTAYDRYALQAFAANAVDYLLKPVEPECLDRALAKVERLRHTGAVAQLDFHKLARQLAESLRDGLPEYPERIASRLGQRICFLELAQVTHFYAEDKLTFAVCASKPYCIDHSIMELERTLNPRKFLRIHRGTLVNIAWIDEIASLPGGALNVRLRDSRRTELVVARDRAQEFKKRLGY